MNGFFMSGEEPIARIENNRLFPIKGELLPLYLQRGGDFNTWIQNRAIDRHRTNSRLLKKILRLQNYDDNASVFRVHGATITDCFWFRGENEADLTYEDVRFSKNYFADIALKGDIQSLQHTYSVEQLAMGTPELTNTGSFEKCWKLEDGVWWLYKNGTALERFSEYVIAAFSQLMGYPTAEYRLEAPYIKSRDFTGGVLNFEPASGIVGDDQDYCRNYDAFYALGGERLADEYVTLMAMDTICWNYDRHTENYGILRDQETGMVLSLAPNFDNNIALLSRGIPQIRENPDDFFFRDFKQLLKERKITFRIPEIPLSALYEIIRYAAEQTGAGAQAQKAARTILTNRYQCMQQLSTAQKSKCKKEIER